MKIKRTTLTVALAVLCFFAEAKVKPVVHYNFGKSGNVTYVVAPDKLKPVTGTGELTALGRPVFYADAPGNKKMKGEGGLLFNGDGDGYRLANPFGTPAENQMLEVWVKPRHNRQREQKMHSSQVVVANGNGKEGYVIVRKGDKWQLISGGSGVVTIGEVAEDVWTHLAMVVDGEKGSV